MTDRERSWTLFGVAMLVISLLYVNDALRRKFVDSELGALSRTSLEASAKAEGAKEAARTRSASRGQVIAILSLIAAIAAVIVAAVAYRIFE